MNQIQFPQDAVDFFADKDEKETLNIQTRMADKLVEELQGFADFDDLTTDLLLDALGICGMSLTIGDVASKAFFANLILEKQEG